MIIWVLLLHHEAFSITIATGSQEGTYYKIAQEIKQIAEKEGIAHRDHFYQWIL
jgi:TRAP-type uncharacterized transport system substrate-binding protein